MADRREFHEILCETLGSKHVYFQPPETIKMVYPAIVYNLSDVKKIHADNTCYKNFKAYTVTYISKDPDSDVPDKLLCLPYADFDRSYSADNLNHYVFTIYF